MSINERMKKKSKIRVNSDELELIMQYRLLDSKSQGKVIGFVNGLLAVAHTQNGATGAKVA